MEPHDQEREEALTRRDGEGTTFELAIRGFGKTIQELQGLERDRRVTLVPHLKALGGGHTFVLTPDGDRTRIDHELEMIPKGAMRVFSPLVGMIGRRNLRRTAAALAAWLERPPGASGGSS